MVQHSHKWTETDIQSCVHTYVCTLEQTCYTKINWYVRSLAYCVRIKGIGFSAYTGQLCYVHTSKQCISLKVGLSLRLHRQPVHSWIPKTGSDIDWNHSYGYKHSGLCTSCSSLRGDYQYGGYH